jgi:hypothetical protein
MPQSYGAVSDAMNKVQRFASTSSCSFRNRSKRLLYSLCGCWLLSYDSALPPQLAHSASQSSPSHHAEPHSRQGILGQKCPVPSA